MTTTTDPQTTQPADSRVETATWHWVGCVDQFRIMERGRLLYNA